jgi:hypothetical protein
MTRVRRGSVEAYNTSILTSFLKLPDRTSTASGDTDNPRKDQLSEYTGGICTYLLVNNFFTLLTLVRFGDAKLG